MKRKLVCLLIALLVSTAMLTACAGDKKPAEEAMRAAEEAINSTKTEAIKYVPDEVKALEDTLVSLKDKFDKGEYKAVITEAQSLAAKAREIPETAKVRKEELTKTWTTLNAEVPTMIEAIRSKVDAISKLKKLPNNLTSDQLTEATSGLSAAREEWAKAIEGFKAGNLSDAVSMANSVKEKVEKTKEIITLSPTQAAPEETVAAAEPEKVEVEKKAAPPKKAGREKARAAKKAPAPERQPAKPEARPSGYMGKVAQVDAKTIVVKGEKGPIAFSLRNPKLKGYSGISNVMIGDTVAAMYINNGKGIVITKIKGKTAPAKKAPAAKKMPKAEKAAPAGAR